jgi:hypothetical protein
MESGHALQHRERLIDAMQRITSILFLNNSMDDLVVETVASRYQCYGGGYRFVAAVRRSERNTCFPSGH